MSKRSIILSKIVFFTSAFGALPVALKVGPLSVSAILTVLISAFALAIFLYGGRIKKASLPVVLPFAMFFLVSMAWYFLRYEFLSDGLVIYPFVWGGFLILLLASAGESVKNLDELNKFNQFLNLISYLYIFVLGGISMVYSEDPATTQVGLIFVAFHLSRLLVFGSKISIFAIALIMLFQTMLLARMVVGAEFVMLMFGVFFLYRSEQDRSVYIKKISFGVALALVLVLVFYFSGFSDKSTGGDQALEVGGVYINTSGRWYWWEIIFDSARRSLFFGYGTPIPNEMIGVDRWNHPHNDYLRIFHQLGLLGLLCWFSFVYFVAKLSIHRSKNCKQGVLQAHFNSVILALIGISITMITDNTIVYSYVMFPFAILVGFQFAFGRHWARI